MSQLTFSYRAVDRRGTRTRGTLRAADRGDAYRKMVAAGLRPIRIARRGRGRASRRAVTVRDQAHITYQFAVLMEARIPIGDGLRSIADQESNPALREIIEDVARQIESGCSVTDAMSPHRELFGDVYVETVRAAEASGTMVKVLERLATSLETSHETRRRVRGALLYPACVLAALGLAVAFLTVFVVPKFADMFERRDLDLPLATTLLMGFSGLVRTYWYVIVAAIGGAAWALRAAWRDATWRRRIDAALHRVPLLRGMLTGLAVSRFARVFGTSLQSGLGLIDALELSGRASARPLLIADAEKMRDQVNQGQRLSDALVACGYLPAFTRRMIAAGEEAAELPKMCEIVARHYEREVAHQAKEIATVVEPILIVGLTVIVLIIALAIFLPMWNMAALVG